MRALVQRVSNARVLVEGAVVGAIDQGLLVFLSVTHNDSQAVADEMAQKVVGLRIFEDDAGRMKHDLSAITGTVLCVSQFTLYGNSKRGQRPSFMAAAPAEIAEPLYDRFCSEIEAAGIRCERGQFGTHMEVSLVNDGPITLLLDSAELELPRNT